MTREQARLLIPAFEVHAPEMAKIVTAYADGEIVEFRLDADDWDALENLSFNWPAENYRIKPKTPPFTPPAELWINVYPTCSNLPSYAYIDRAEADRLRYRNAGGVCARYVLEP